MNVTRSLTMIQCNDDTHDANDGSRSVVFSRLRKDYEDKGSPKKFPLVFFVNRNIFYFIHNCFI